LHVHIEGRTGLEGIDVSRADVVTALRDRRPVSTSRPSPDTFVSAYRKALDEGASAVVSVHISQELSGTCDSARLAAREFEDGLVHVVDSRSTAMGLGTAVISAAEVAAAGGTAEEVAQAAVESIDRSSCLFYVDSLEWLHRGGRVGTAAAVLGTALAVKPILHIVSGRILPLEKVRTSSKAIARLVQIAIDAAGQTNVDIAVQHLEAADRAAEVADKLRNAVPNIRRFYESEVGPVVGSHVGPGLIGIVIRRLPSA
jgi:DegV family protein with EDD domain